MKSIKGIDKVFKSNSRLKNIYDVSDAYFIVELHNRLKVNGIYSSLLEYEKTSYRFNKFIKSCEEFDYLVLLSTRGLMKYNFQWPTESVAGRTIVLVKKEGKNILLRYNNKEFHISVHKFRKIYLFDKKQYISNLSFYIFNTKK